jgi:Transcriptional regulators
VTDIQGGDQMRSSVLADDINFLAVKASAEGTRLANRLLAEHGLRVRSYAVLALANGERPVTQRDLADVLSLDPSQIVALVDDLERDGLVRREVDPSDRRSRVVRSTDDGRARFTVARSATAAAEADLLAPLDLAERETLRSLLARVILRDA